MSLTIDANIWLASSDPREPGGAACGDVLVAVSALGERLESPTLLQVEIAGATSRKTGNNRFAEEFLQEVLGHSAHHWHALDSTLAAAAAALAIACRLRGADAVYVAVAALTGSTLITLDREMQRRVEHLIDAVTPEEWLATHRN